MTKSKIFLYFCLSFIFGIFLNSLVSISQLAMLGILFFGILLISVFWPFDKLRVNSGRKHLVVVGFCLLILVLGAWRHQTSQSRIFNNELRNYIDSNKEITLLGRVSSEPDIRDSHIKLIIKIKEIQPQNNDFKILKLKREEKVLVTTQRYPEYRHNDQLKITGFLKTPQVFDGFNYRDYLAKDGIYSVMYNSEIQLLNRKNYGSPTSIVYAKILDLKNKLRESIYGSLSPPQSSILGAMILGDKRKMSNDLKEKLNIVGLRHITAISGMHITIITFALMFLGTTLGLWRGQAFYFAIIILILFIIMIGAPASAIRAGIMGGLLLLGQKLGRLSTSSRAVVFAAALMLYFNPLLLRLDVGFQLSFLAVMGIIYLMPIFQNWLKKLPNPKIFPLRSLLVMSLAAQIFTLPILVYNFGRMSLVAPITNILVVPFLPLVMGLGFLFAFIGIIWQPISWVLSWPCWLVLTYISKIVDGFFSFSFASLTFQISWLWLIILYLILGVATWYLRKKFGRDNLLPFNYS